MCIIGIIGARSINGVIGNNNSLPWHLPSDLQHFRNLTTNKIIIMGRKTYESIGKPLPNRTNIVISSNSGFVPPDGVIVAPDPKEALRTARKIGGEHSEAWVIGGTSIYQAFIKRADKMILTTIQTEVKGDAVFPTWKDVFWKLNKTTNHYDPKGYILENQNIKGLEYTIEEYERVL
jgi:dihydrofolate reductase